MTPAKDNAPPNVRLPADLSARRTGIAYGLAAYLLWGFFPLFFKQLAHVPPLQVLAHRIVWSLPTLALIIAAAGGWSEVRKAVLQRRVMLTLCSTTLLIAVNWFVFILAVTQNEVLQSSLGYFINPLVSVLLGFLFLRERLNRLQTASVAAAFVGVSILAVQGGGIPWIALVLAVTFGVYGLLRKVVNVGALTGLFVETLLLFPVAAGYLLFIGQQGSGAFLAISTSTTIFLVLAGVITAIPLLWFSLSARLLPLSTVGFMQYLTPTIHFLLAVLLFSEFFDLSYLLSFLCIWTGLGIYSFDAARSIVAGRKAGGGQQK